MSDIPPRLGDLVYVVYQQRPWAAIVTHVWDPERINCYVFPDGSHLFGRLATMTAIPFAPAERRHDNTWHWPEEETTEDPVPALPVSTAPRRVSFRPPAWLRRMYGWR